MRKENLVAGDADWAMSEILRGDALEPQIAAFAVALRSKGETVVEMTAMLDTMMRFAEHVPSDGLDVDSLVDTCGTGGDRSGTINVSTLAACAVAGAGVVVAKHGNRSASSQCGSADLLEALGVTIDLGPVGVARCLVEAGFGFCLAPRFHAALRHAGPTRRAIGVATTFNFLGPLANPVGVRRQTIGVSDGAMAARVAGVLQARGAIRAWVFHGHDGLDELTTTGPSTVHEVRDGEVWTFTVDPAEMLRIERVEAAALRGGDTGANAEIARRVLDGERGPVHDVVALNAAAALVVADRAATLAEGFELARASLADGAAAAALDRLVKVSASASTPSESVD
jgi:anthranilate phosphoribosyltransferase